MDTMQSASPACPSCGRGPDPATGKIHHRATEPRPDIATLEEWASEAGAEATDGCWVEPDGRCEHGHQSWLLRLGFI